MTSSQTTTTCSAAAVKTGSTSSDSKLLEDEIGEEVRVIMRPKRPPRPKSEVFLDRAQKRRSKRFSAFGVSQALNKFDTSCLLASNAAVSLIVVGKHNQSHDRRRTTVKSVPIVACSQLPFHAFLLSSTCCKQRGVFPPFFLALIRHILGLSDFRLPCLALLPTLVKSSQVCVPSIH